MKTKELIRQLQEADPSGEIEVAVGNTDIHFLELQPAYYDGPLQVLSRDLNSKYYNITGVTYKRTGSKICIHTLSASDVISQDDDAIIDYSELSEESRIATKKAHDSLREFVSDIENELELEHFLKWAKKQAEKLTVDTEDIKAVASNFFKKHISRNDPLPEGGIPLGKNYIETREQQWNEKYQVHIENGFLKIKSLLN